MDYRLENRKQAFSRWYEWSLYYKDCDPAIWLANYIFDRFEFNSEQRFWLCWLYANTYYYPTAYILWNEFPDFELCDSIRIKEWNNINYPRLRYQTDTKYNKGHLPAMFESYKQNVGVQTQKQFFEQFYGDNEQQTFENLWNHISGNFHKFGRYTTWFYLQSLVHCCDVPAQPTSLYLSDYSGSRSHRNGLCLALGKDDWIDVRLTPKEYEWLEEEAKQFLTDTFADENYFTLETCLCSFKKIFREKNGRYLGYYLDRQAEEISKVQQDGWYGIDWEVLWDARFETLTPRLYKKHAKIQKERFTGFINTGKIDRLEWLYEDEAVGPQGIEIFV